MEYLNKLKKTLLAGSGRVPPDPVPGDVGQDGAKRRGGLHRHIPADIRQNKGRCYRGVDNQINHLKF